MEVLVEHMSELASRVLEIFGNRTRKDQLKKSFYESFFSEPIVAKASNDSEDNTENTYFVSFLLHDRKNKTSKNEDGNLKQRMVVNNNFSGEKMGTSQVYVESGQPPSQPPMHNIQLLKNKNPQKSFQKHMYQPQNNPQHRFG